MENEILNINGKSYKWENISVVIPRIELDRVVSVKYDGFKKTVEFAKNNNIKLIYGAGNLPLGIEYPNDFKINELVEIDLLNVTFEDWVKY